MNINADYFTPTGLFFHGAGPGDQFRAVVRIAPEARAWDGHAHVHGIESRHGGHSPATIKVTGRSVRADYRGPRTVYRVAVRLTFDGATETVGGDLVFLAPVTLDEARSRVARFF